MPLALASDRGRKPAGMPVSPRMSARDRTGVARPASCSPLRLLSSALPKIQLMTVQALAVGSPRLACQRSSASRRFLTRHARIAVVLPNSAVLSHGLAIAGELR